MMYQILTGSISCHNDTYLMVSESAAVQETEPDDIFVTACNLGIVTDQISVTGSMTLNDQDYYVFTVNEPGFFEIEISGSENKDTVLLLFDSGMNQIAADDDSGTGAYSKFGENLEIGLYYLEAFEYYGNAIGSYTLTITRHPVTQTEPNNSFETAYELGTITGECRIEHQGITAGDSDYYRFVLTEAAFVTISAEFGTPEILLYNGEHQLISSARSSLLGADLDAGTYFVLMRSDEPVRTYDLVMKNYGLVQDLVLEGNYSESISSLANVQIKSGTAVNAYFPAAVQILVSSRTVTVGNDVSLSCNSIRNAAILFGEDAYWGGFSDGTVTFTGASATLTSKVSNCITAGGIVGNDLTVNFSEAADNSSGISFVSGQNSGPGNEAGGILARKNLTVNGNFGGKIDSCFDFSLLSSSRGASVSGLYSSENLVFNGGISGTITAFCFTANESNNALAYGLYAGEALTVSGDISGTIAAWGGNSAYAVRANGQLDISLTGTLFAGRAAAGLSQEAAWKLNDPKENETWLLNQSASFNAVYGGTESRVTLKAGSAVWGGIRLGGKSNLTISSEAILYGDVSFPMAYSESNVTFLLEGIADHSAVRGNLQDNSGRTAITIDATNASDGQYILAENWNLSIFNTLQITAGTETISRSSATLSGSRYLFSFSNGMKVEWDSAAGLTLNVTGTTAPVTPDYNAPVLGSGLFAQVTGTDVVISWDAASDDTGIAGYRFRYGNSSDLSGEGQSISTNTCSLTDLSNGVYYYQYQAYDAAGNSSEWSPVQNFTIDYTKPVYVPYIVPQAEYMYGCTATVIGMLIGYYDLYGYMGYDVSNLIDGTVELDARGLDGNAYDMNAFDTVLGSAIASPEYVERFVNKTPEYELPYTFIENTVELNVSVWNCLADYLGTGQYWRGNSDLSTSQYFASLDKIKSWTFTNNRSAGSISLDVPAQYSDFLYGLDLYVRNAGYQLDSAQTKTVYTDNNGGSFSFADYKKEINAGKLVVVHVDGHSMLGYGYDNSTQEIIFDDTYRHDCRMTWGGKYYYSNADRDLESVSIITFDTDNLSEINHNDTTAPGDLNADGRADIVMTITEVGHGAEGATGAWLIQEDQTAAWGDLSTRDSGWEIFGTGKTAAGKKTDDVYIRSTSNIIGAWTTGDDGKVNGWETIGEFSADTQIIGLGDFNADGQTDLLLRNVNGAVGCFFTKGEKTGWNYFQSLGDEWKLSAVGDLNGDGRDDVVLKHDAGFAGSWLTQEDGTMAWADLDTLPDGFEIVGAGDFNADGTDDVLLKSGNYYGAWLVNNGNAAGWMGLGDLGDVTVEQIADFNGDGKDDLRIRTAAGDLGTQLVMGEDSLVWKYYGSVGSEWSTSLAALA